MWYENDKHLHIVLNDLFNHYREHVKNVDEITQALIQKGVIEKAEDIENDHIAFRTLGVPHLGIQSLERIFLAYGYRRMDSFYFPIKKLKAYWYAPPEETYPRIFASELMVSELSAEAQKIIHKYTDPISSDPVDALDLTDGYAVAKFLQTPLWEVPTSEEYSTLLKESEYAAWVIFNRYYLNHYTISIHALLDGYNTLEEFNDFLEGIGVELNDSGGKIKVSEDGLLKQSSTVSALYPAEFADVKTLEIAGSYVEFAERKVLPKFKDVPTCEIKREHRRDGFETGNADRIFESTYTSQIYNK